MLNKNDDAVMVDFGVAALFEKDDDSVKGTVGSIRYFAPEIVKTGGPKIVKGRQADVWAFGVTLYNMVTRKFPFPASNIQDL